MSCSRCPHHVRHGQVDAQGRIVFHDVCGLKVKRLERTEETSAMPKKIAERKGAKAKVPLNPKRYGPEQACNEVPFSVSFDYMNCQTYIETFKLASKKNDVIPTKDFQFSRELTGGSITDMELL